MVVVMPQKDELLQERDIRRTLHTGGGYHNLNLDTQDGKDWIPPPAIWLRRFEISLGATTYRLGLKPFVGGSTIIHLLMYAVQLAGTWINSPP